MVEIDVISVWRTGLDFISMKGWNSFGCVGGRSRLVTCMLAKITCLYNEHENWHVFCVNGPNWYEFSVGDRTWHHFNLGVKLVWLLCEWSKLTRFCTRGKNHFFQCEQLNVVGGRNWLDFNVGDQPWLDYSAGCNWNGCVGCRKWLHFNAVDRHWLSFSVAIENDLVLSSGSKLTCSLCGGQNRHRFSLRAENYFVIIYRSELTWFLAWGSKLTWFSCAGRKWLALNMGIDWVNFRAGGRNWLDFICWLKITWS